MVALLAAAGAAEGAGDGVSDTMIVAAITGLLAVIGTLAGVLAKGRIDRSRFREEVAARREDQWAELRLNRCAALVTALERGRAELEEQADAADGNGFDAEGALAWSAMPTTRPGYLTSALGELVLIAPEPVVEEAHRAASVAWDALAAAYRHEMRAGWQYTTQRDKGGRAEGFEEKMFTAGDDLRAAITAAETAVDKLRVVMRRSLTSTHV